MQPIIDFFQDPTGIAVGMGAFAAILGGGVCALLMRRGGARPPSSADFDGSGLEAPATSGGEELTGDEGGELSSSTSKAGPAAGAPSTEEPQVADQADDAGAPEVEAARLETPQVETPESLPSRMTRLRGRLARSGAFGKALLSIFSRGDLSEADWEEIEDSLLVADLGLEATDELMEALRTRVKVEATTDPARVRAMLVEELLTLVGPDTDRSLHLDPHETDSGRVPATVLVVGVNGAGKTTTVGKLARVLLAENHSVLLGAADTFRAAAAEQLTTWGQRVGVEVVRSEREGADPASVAFDAVKVGVERGVEVVLVDTAGRLQTKATLMDELGKVKRVMERHAPVDEVLLVLDATTGQNGMRQAQVFGEVAGVTGIVLTKLDGSAKGGIVVSVQRELGVPVKFVGLGEGADDLAPFDPRSFVEAIVGA
ncbi:signal recognition particle-docking protein FtsY [Schaalia sp. 19OD2882]|uniref:signal recognition particle-docking protein FtsY n=1 Tax=Schaalia sp. 19OD2882 TaxID=2794089 RepID=UPI001C1EE743|nr:signal recognition particle-docking protein FtsY [Schaalia sp. 19OD2882]QWW18830.1 signal recognition particle-docking protein FtsY [Schaalia sp. 19OD2882]